MPPKNYANTIRELQDWINAETSRKHSMAVKYIEENVDLIDTDLQKFMDDCPTYCHLEVYEMLLKAGIDMKDYVINDTLKQWNNYIHDYAIPYYPIDYKHNLDENIKETITWKADWQHGTIVLDTIPALKEV